MIVRVDDFPHGRKGDETMGGDPWGMLDGFLEAFPHPFLLAVLFGPCVKAGKLGGVFCMPERVTVAAHGWLHTHDDAKMAAHVKAMQLLLGPDAVFVPPFNALDQIGVDTLAWAGYRFVTTGPETPDGLDFRAIREIPPAFYGTAKQFVEQKPRIPEWGCVALHLTWEKNDGFKSLATMGEMVNGQVHHWREFMEAVHV